MTELNAKIPAGPLAQKWSNHKAHINVVSPANKRKLDVIIVGTGLAGGSAAASLAELGYNVTTFCYQDSPRRALSLHKEVSMLLRTTRTIMTLYTGYFMKLLKVVTTVLVRLTCIVWQR